MAVYIIPDDAVASSEFSATYSALKAIDSDVGTHWLSSSKTGSQWIYFDLGESKRVGAIRVYMIEQYVPSTFDLQSSDDASDWNTELSDCTVSTGNTWVELELADPVKARYFRMLMKSSGGSYYLVTEVTFVESASVSYELLGTYTTLPIDTTTLPASLHIRWTATTPTDTSVKVEYSLTETNSAPGTWTEVSNEGTITVNDNYLWLRYTLETTDDEVTPTLEEVWLEDVALDPTQILLTCYPIWRFQNVEGNITIAYDSAVGNLEGLGGIVESFEQAFTPADLERMIKPHLFENLKCVPTVDIIFARVYYVVVGDGDWPTDDYRSIKYVREYDAGPPEVLEQQKGALEAEKLLCKPTIGLTLIHVDVIDP